MRWAIGTRGEAEGPPLTTVLVQGAVFLALFLWFFGAELFPRRDLPSTGDGPLVAYRVRPATTLPCPDTSCDVLAVSAAWARPAVPVDGPVVGHLQLAQPWLIRTPPGQVIELASRSGVTRHDGRAREVLGEFVPADQDSEEQSRQLIYMREPGVALWPASVSSPAGPSDARHAPLHFQEISHQLTVQVGELPFDPEPDQECELSFGKALVVMRLWSAQPRPGGWTLFLKPPGQESMSAWLATHADQLWGARRAALPTELTIRLLRREKGPRLPVFRVPSSALVREGSRSQVWVLAEGWALPVQVQRFRQDGQDTLVQTSPQARGRPVNPAHWAALAPWQRQRISRWLLADSPSGRQKQDWLSTYPVVLQPPEGVRPGMALVKKEGAVDAGN